MSHAQSTPETQANEIAQKMKDTLALTEQQKTQLQSATLKIQNIRSGLRQLYVGRALGNYLGIAEDNRDSAYKGILSGDKYTLYLQKRATLLSNY